MSDMLQRCEALMLQSKVQFVLSHAHSKAQGALDAEPYRSARIGEDVLIAVSAPKRRRRARVTRCKSATVRFPCSGTPKNLDWDASCEPCSGEGSNHCRSKSFSPRTLPRS